MWVRNLALIVVGQRQWGACGREKQLVAARKQRESQGGVRDKVSFKAMPPVNYFF